MIDATVKVKVINENPEGDLLSTALGISDERLEELQSLIRSKIGTGVPVSKVLEQLSRETNHVNELVFTVFAFGTSIGIINFCRESSGNKDGVGFRRDERRQGIKFLNHFKGDSSLKQL